MVQESSLRRKCGSAPLAGSFVACDIRRCRLDCSQSPATCYRFNVTMHPTIIFFRHGVMYRYRGEITEEAVLVFAAKRGYLSPSYPAMPDRLLISHS